MTNSYNQAGLNPRLRQLSLTAALLAGGALTAQAQFFTASNVANTAGTYTDISTSSSSTVISTSGNFDDANSAVQTIPFSFTFGGTAFTQFYLNTNGYIKLANTGTTAPAAPYFSTFAQEAYTGGPLNTATETNLLLPFNTDLQAGTGTPEYRMDVTGTGTSRVLTIQWKNVSDKTRAASSAAAGNIDKQFSNFSFQVKLYEGTNRVDFVYGTATPNTAGTTNANFVVVGVKGNTATQAVTAVKASNTAWSQTTFQDGVYTNATNAHNIRSVASVTGGTPLPDAGRTYSFVPQVATDAAVQIVYNTDQLVVPAGSPTVVRALVRNSGTAALTNVSVALNVTGPTTASGGTQVVNSLAAGATSIVTFAPLTLTATGTHTLTVTATVANDGNTTNNTATALTEANATTFSYVTPNVNPNTSVGFGAGSENYFAAKYTLTAPRDIVSVRARIEDANSVGNILYGVVIDPATGNINGRSAPYTVVTADIGQFHTFTLTAPTSLNAGDFLVGMVQRYATGNTTQFFPMAVQGENPTRPGTFFTGSATTAAAPADASSRNFGKYMVEAITAAPATCPAPTNIALTASTPTTVTLSFTASNGAVSYQFIYGATGFNPASAGTTTTSFTTPNFQITGLTGATCYDVYVRATCSAANGQSALAGPFNACTPCTPPTITSFPYTQNFNTLSPGQDLPCGITVQDTNNDGNTWEATNSAPNAANTALINVANGGTGNAMVYVFNPNATTPADDWFFTPALRLTANSTYRLSFAYRAIAAAFTEGLEVKYGTTATPAGQTTTLYTNSVITGAAYRTANNTSTPAVADIRPTTTGIYYIGFHANSAADQSSLIVDDLNITAVLGTSAALTKAVTVFPNPSTNGIFNLDIQGANARQAMSVEVTNVLGQRVYTGSAKDNFRTEVNLSNLPAGLYTLKVKNGAEFTSQQVSIAK